MEETGGTGMVNHAFQPEFTPLIADPGSEELAATVHLSEVINAGIRLEASAYNIEAYNTVNILENSGLPLIPLYGDNALCREAHNAFRFKRIYVNAEKGVPFLSSSEIISLNPKTEKYLSLKQTKNLDKLLVQKWDILISRSGTIGNIGLATESLVGKAISEDVIRLRANDGDTAGYVAAFLRSRYGRPQLTRSSYGSVIVHIEPEHLKRVLIPDLPVIRRIAIGRLMCSAGELRDEANRLLDTADKLLHERLNLPYLNSISSNIQVPSIAKIKASQLMGRLEGSFHDPTAFAAEKGLHSLTVEITSIGDKRITKEVRAITKFRKRVYTEKGIPFLNSKELFQIDPVGVKRLARGAHLKDLPEIALEENMLAVTRSGTVGNVQIIPAYMDGWTASEDSIRVISSSTMNPGFLYAWLSSDYGECLTKRQTYGSVIVHLDREMLGSIPIPFPKANIRDEIGDLVLKANALRDEAWRKEKEAISQIERLISSEKISTTNKNLLSNVKALKEIPYDNDAPPIWELVAQISAQVPDEEWAKLPTDLSKRFDYYQTSRND